MREATMRINRYVLAAALTGCGSMVHAGDLRVTGQFVSEATSGPPLAVSSTDLVPNLNADRLDGFDIGDFAVEGSGVGVNYKNLVGVPGEEIDQDCAVNTGCFAGDSPGFPVTITEPGSYRLAGNLDVSGEADPEDVTVINIDSSNVTLDLMGFSIQGPVTCDGTPVTSCSHASGQGYGIALFPHNVNASISNGMVRGMGQIGVACFSPCRVDNVWVTENRSLGLSITGMVSNSTAWRNGGTGISAAKGAVIRDSLSAGNLLHGIQSTSPNDGSTVSGNRVMENGGNGIHVRWATVLNNSARFNSGRGFTLNRSIATANVAADNGSDGYSCSSSSLVDNVSVDNGGWGITFSGAACAWKSNMMSGNTDGDFDGAAVKLGENACSGALC